MANLFENAYFGDKIVNVNQANLSVASSAVLYGLSVYTVLSVLLTPDGSLVAFRLKDHYQRLIDSAHIIGIDHSEADLSYDDFKTVIKDLLIANQIKSDVFVRVSVHVNELVPGPRSRNLKTALSIFLYDASPILLPEGARLKTSVWRRVADNAIPARAKVNGAYVNSVLAKQDAIDSGYDDCIFLDQNGHVCELSAANIFIVRNGRLITPDSTSDILEGITRRSIIQVAKDNGIEVEERTVDLTEVYIADEVFVSGTSAFVSPIVEVDARKISGGNVGPITQKLGDLHKKILHGQEEKYQSWLTKLG